MNPEDENLGAEVIPFPGKDTDERDAENLPLRSASPWAMDEPRCNSRHARARVHEGTRRLRCVECDAELDPFDFLVRMAHELERYVGAIRDLRLRRERLGNQVLKLERDERNTKSRLKLAKKRLAEFEAKHGTAFTPPEQLDKPA